MKIEQLDSRIYTQFHNYKKYLREIGASLMIVVASITPAEAHKHDIGAACTPYIEDGKLMVQVKYNHGDERYVKVKDNANGSDLVTYIQMKPNCPPTGLEKPDAKKKQK
ncbi:MAG: hypothetical protein Q8R04_07190 [Nanoarchaeota archaeon]|nr:hypothetical protein [Nanoarchaeota archaeon]